MGSSLLALTKFPSQLWQRNIPYRHQKLLGLHLLLKHRLVVQGTPVEEEHGVIFFEVRHTLITIPPLKAPKIERRNSMVLMHTPLVPARIIRHLGAILDGRGSQAFEVVLSGINLVWRD